MDNLKLTLPSPTPGTQLLIETRPDEFILWLEGLPSGNMIRFVTEVADAVSNLNRTDLPIAQRIELTQMADTAYEKIHNYYRPLMKDGPHKGKLAPKAELAEVYRLTQEMSFAYKTAVYAYVGKKTFFRKNKNLANAINMSLHYLGLVLLEHYEHYSPVPMHIWREIHQLYNYAEQRNLSELEIPQNTLKCCFDNSETSYIRICLMALSNPYHLKIGDHWEVFSYLTYWSSEAIISEDPDDFTPKECFVIDLDSDDKPESVKILDYYDDPQIRFLLTKKLIIKLNQHIASIEYINKSPENCFSKNVVARKATELLESMQDNWEMKQERTSPRYNKINRIEMIMGLGNIHKCISSYDPLLPNNSQTDKDQNAGLIERYWNTVDISNGGISISRPKEKVDDIDVGLLVAIRQSNNAATTDKWQLGFICWITGNERDGTQLGIEYIKGDIQAVKLQARKGNKIDTRFQPALMVSGVQVHGLLTPTLLTSSGLYIESRALVLQIGEEEQYIHARMKVTSTGTTDRFFYQPDTRETPKKNQTRKIDNSEEDEIINISDVKHPIHRGEINNDKPEPEKIVTLDDVIVSKNK